jgi:aspartate racemase
MKTIGLLGGMSWESSIEYYRIINEEVKQRLGGYHSAQSLMYSVDFAEIEALQHSGRWDEAGSVLAEAARQLERGGAELLVLCTNTMHRVAGAIQAAIDIPMLHISDPTAEAIGARGLRKVGLLGTRFTMEQDFYKGRMTDRHGLTILTPDEHDRTLIHRVIYEELVLGVIREPSRQAYFEVIDRLAAAGAEGIILGCTEISLLVKPGDTALPLFDTTYLHATAAVSMALEE